MKPAKFNDTGLQWRWSCSLVKAHSFNFQILWEAATKGLLLDLDPCGILAIQPINLTTFELFFRAASWTCKGSTPRKSTIDYPKSLKFESDRFLFGFHVTFRGCKGFDKRKCLCIIRGISDQLFHCDWCETNIWNLATRRSTPSCINEFQIVLRDSFPRQKFWGAFLVWNDMQIYPNCISILLWL